MLHIHLHIHLNYALDICRQKNHEHTEKDKLYHDLK